MHGAAIEPYWIILNLSYYLEKENKCVHLDQPQVITNRISADPRYQGTELLVYVHSLQQLAWLQEIKSV